MALAKHEDMVEQFTPESADKALGEGVHVRGPDPRCERLWCRRLQTGARTERLAWRGVIAVAVADFANEADDNDLDGLPEMLITSLEQSRRLLILTRSRMVDVLVQMGRSEVRLGTSPVNHTPGSNSDAAACSTKLPPRAW